MDASRLNYQECILKRILSEISAREAVKILISIEILFPKPSQFCGLIFLQNIVLFLLSVWVFSVFLTLCGMAGFWSRSFWSRSQPSHHFTYKQVFKISLKINSFVFKHNCNSIISDVSKISVQVSPKLSHKCWSICLNQDPNMSHALWILDNSLKFLLFNKCSLGDILLNAWLLCLSSYPQCGFVGCIIIFSPRTFFL